MMISSSTPTTGMSRSFPVRNTHLYWSTISYKMAGQVARMLTNRRRRRRAIADTFLPSGLPYRSCSMPVWTRGKIHTILNTKTRPNSHTRYQIIKNDRVRSCLEDICSRPAHWRHIRMSLNSWTSKAGLSRSSPRLPPSTRSLHYLSIRGRLTQVCLHVYFRKY